MNPLYFHRTMIVCVLFLVCLSRLSEGNKYSQKLNLQDEKDSIANIEKEDNPFRMRKVNVLWTKAKKMLPGSKLAELYADLKIHDHQEAKLKKLKAEKLDEDGFKAAEVLESYEDILERYGLGDDRQDNDIPLTNEGTKQVYFQDIKLQSMWRRAQRSGFSDEDLEVLKEEFWHQQMKLNQLDFLKRELNTDEDYQDDNEIKIHDLKVDMSLKEKKEKMHHLKKQNRDVQEGYLRLEHMAATLPKQELEFKDYRVQKLWALAKKTNWSEEEMEGFKEELKHFEHRLSKQDYYKEQLELSEYAMKDKVDDKGLYPEKVVRLRQKTNDVKHKVNKLHNHMKARLEKALKHSEL